MKIIRIFSFVCFTHCKTQYLKIFKMWNVQFGSFSYQFATEFIITLTPATIPTKLDLSEIFIGSG